MVMKCESGKYETVFICRRLPHQLQICLEFCVNPKKTDFLKVCMIEEIPCIEEGIFLVLCNALRRLQCLFAVSLRFHD